MTWWTVIQAALLVLAAAAVFAGVQRGRLVGGPLPSSANADWGWIVLGFVLSQLPRLTQAVAMLGSIAARLPFIPVYMKQLATCYLNLAMPSSVARMALSVRFFQCQGLPGSDGCRGGGDRLAGQQRHPGPAHRRAVALRRVVRRSDLSAPSGGSATLLWILVGLLVATVLIFVFVGRVRRPVMARVRKWWPEVRDSVVALRASDKLWMLTLGNIATELLFSAALACSPTRSATASPTARSC